MSPISHSYKLDQSISEPMVAWWYLYFYSDFNRTFYKKPWRPWLDAEEQSLNELIFRSFTPSPILTLYNWQ